MPGQQPTPSRSRGMPVLAYQKIVLSLCAITILISVCIISVVSLQLFAKLTGKSNVIDVEAHTAIACIPMEEIIQYKPNDILFNSLRTVIHQEGPSRKCAHNSEEMSILLQLAMRRPDLPAEPLPVFNISSFSLSSAFVHKNLLAPPGHSHQQEPSFDQAYITFNATHTDLLRNIDVHQDKLCIKGSGIYFIYSSLHFKLDSNKPCSSLRFQTWEHSVKANQKTLMKTVYTCCDNCGRDGETSFISGVFNLTTGDNIQLMISGHGLGYFKKEISYAGLWKLGTGS